MPRNRQQRKSKALAKLEKSVCVANEQAIFTVKQQCNITLTLSYDIQWNDFPNSLRLRCEAGEPITADVQLAIRALIQRQYLKVGIRFKQVAKNIVWK